VHTWSGFSTDPSMNMSPYPCEEATETALARGRVPHFLPGRSPIPKLKTMPKPAKVMTGGGEGGN